MRHTAKKIQNPTYSEQSKSWHYPRLGYRGWNYRGYIIKNAYNDRCWIVELPYGKEFASLTKKGAKQAIDNIIEKSAA